MASVYRAIIFGDSYIVGERWAQTTGHLFAMVELQRNGMDVASQLNEVFRAR